MNEKYDALISSFIDNNIGLCDAFLSKDLSKHLQHNLMQLDRDNKMLPAGIGNNNVKDPTQKIRGDKIYWIDKKNNDEHELAFLQEVENFIEHLNATCYTGINAYEFHYALYDAGSYYHKHRDQFQNNQDRKYSLINYLNDDWEEKNGGALIVYQEEKAESILPDKQKAIFFQSNQLEHEVAIAHRPRMSITGWLKCV